MELAELLTLRDELKRAIFSGLLRYRTSDGRDMQYQSAADMRHALSRLESEIADASGSPRAFVGRGVPARG